MKKTEEHSSHTVHTARGSCRVEGWLERSEFVASSVLSH